VTRLIVHEWLTNYAGSERVVAALRTRVPGTTVATTMRFGDPFDSWDVHTTPLQRLARGSSSHVRALSMMPAAWQLTALPDVDEVITSFHTFSLFARVPADIDHAVYCHTPPRFLYLSHQFGERASPLTRSLVGLVRGALVRLDQRRARNRPIRWLANSRTTARRIKDIYGVDAGVVHPPVDIARFERAFGCAPRGDHYLAFGRLVPYKRIDIAVEAFRRLGARLVVAGGGRQLASLRAIAPPNVSFIGPVDEARVPELLAGARALVFPGEEDFGIVPIEAMAAGTPVIAFRSGGCAETVVPGTTGVFMEEQTPDALISAVREFEESSFVAAELQTEARRYGFDGFHRAFEAAAWS
jgi:glycosyltransferase involved in cell wall biosynthesis